jgi:hypothetical protein
MNELGVFAYARKVDEFLCCHDREMFEEVREMST